MLLSQPESTRSSVILRLYLVPVAEFGAHRLFQEYATYRHQIVVFRSCGKFTARGDLAPACMRIFISPAKFPSYTHFARVLRLAPPAPPLMLVAGSSVHQT